MTEMTVSRQKIIDTLKMALERADYVRAAWLGGSDATGRTDRLSDIDLQIIAEDERVEEAFALTRRSLETLSPIEHSYRFPEPTWHGHSQEILRLRDADPNHFVDLVVMKRSNPDRLLEKERHGTALVLFDHDRLLEPQALDWRTHRRKIEQRLAVLREQFPLLQPLVTRGLRRGHIAESAYAYQVLTLKPLVELLRMRYCPERYDFGLRYLDRDLPAQWREEVETLAYPSTPGILEEMHKRAADRFEMLVRAFDAGVWTLPECGGGGEAR